MRHQDYRHRISSLPKKTLIVLGLHQMGWTNTREIAKAAGWVHKSAPKVIDPRPVDHVAAILAAAEWGLPLGVYGDLNPQKEAAIKRSVMCPSCHAQIDKVPCVYCQHHGIFVSRLQDQVQGLYEFKLFDSEAEALAANRTSPQGRRERPA